LQRKPEGEETFEGSFDHRHWCWKLCNDRGDPAASVKVSQVKLPNYQFKFENLDKFFIEKLKITLVSHVYEHKYHPNII
jgi:hypothetical protein